MHSSQDNSYPPKLRSWQIWWKLLRPHTLTASFVPVAIGTALALPHGAFRADLFIAMLSASILIQAAVNMLNEYYDYKRGLDHELSVGIGGTIVRDGVAPKTVLAIAQGVLGIAFFLGMYLCLKSSWLLLPVGLSCVAAGYLYSGGPYPISATPFGELVSGFFMGLVIIAIAFFIQTGTVTIAALLVSIPTSILVGAILMANNIRDLEGDKLHGRKTLAILLGKNSATIGLAAMFTAAYAWVLLLIYTGIMTPWTLLAFASIPKALHAVQGFRHHTTPIAMMPAMVATAQTNTLFGLLLALGLLIPHLLH